MTISYSLAPIPNWYFADLFGRPLGGGYMKTLRSLNKVENKPVYQDIGGNFPWTNPILFNENGAQGPFYWKTDTADLTDTYFLQIFDSDDNLVFEIDNFFPPGSGGGSSTNFIQIRNLIANPVFFRNIGTSQNPLPVSLTLSPDNHELFATPDTVFLKNNTNATDQIIFTPFGLGNNPLTGDVTPEYYLNYACTNTPAGETFKYVQYPLSAHVKTLENQLITVSVWAQGVSGTQTLQLMLKQNFGSGGSPSAEVITNITTLTLSSGWVKYINTFSIPNVSGKVLGSCGDDATYLLIGYPLGQSCSINHVKAAVYLGNINPIEDFESYDKISSVTDTPRPGDWRIAFNDFNSFGWVPADDGSIGSSASGATTRADIDTFFLYKTIWDNVSNTYAPVTGGRGGSAVDDFSADKAIFLTKTLGRAISSYGQGIFDSTFTANTTTEYLTLASGTAGAFYNAVPVTLTTTGTLPAPLALATTYYVILIDSTNIQLATTPQNAINGVFIDLTTTGTGVHTIAINYTNWSMGQFVGEINHGITIPESASHKHSFNIDSIGNVGAAQSSATNGGQTQTPEPDFINNTGGSTPMNNMQPTTFARVFFKL